MDDLPTCPGCGEMVYYRIDGAKLNATKPGPHECPARDDGGTLIAVEDMPDGLLAPAVRESAEDYEGRRRAILREASKRLIAHREDEDGD